MPAAQPEGNERIRAGVGLKDGGDDVQHFDELVRGAADQDGVAVDRALLLGGEVLTVAGLAKGEGHVDVLEACSCKGHGAAEIAGLGDLGRRLRRDVAGEEGRSS